MSRLIRMPSSVLLFAIAIVICLGGRANAQVTSTSGSGTTSFGNFSWQVDRAPITTTINAVAGFNTPPPGPPAGLFTTPVSVASPFTLHELHGNFALATWPTWNGNPSSCGNGSIIAQVLDQNGNTLAAVKLQVLGPSTTNVPIEGTFSTPLSITSLTLQYDVDLCGAQTVSLALVMS
jgi:hypothetical protein